MSRPRKALRTVRKEVYLPEDLVARVELRLFSNLEGRVPYGAWAAVLEPLLRHALDQIDQETDTLLAIQVEGADLFEQIARMLDGDGHKRLAALLRERVNAGASPGFTTKETTNA